LLLLLAAGGSLAAAEPPSIGWQEAVARLAAERTRAETCAALLKKHGDEAARSRGELDYGAAKAEVDGVIAGLVVALALRSEPGSVGDLEERLRRGVAAREAFCAEVTPLVPERTGEKSVIADLAQGAIKPIVEALKAIWLDAAEARRKQDRLTAKTIQTQLEATKWPAFSAVVPSA
jgi:hypothetical protein